MKNGLVAVVASVVVAGIAGCSSSPSSPPPPAGSLPPLTAHVTVNGQNAGDMRGISCATQGDGAIGTPNSRQYVTIDNGDRAWQDEPAKVTTGWSAAVQSVVQPDAPGAFKLVPMSVQIRNLGGFTGAFWDKLTGDAKATVTGDTYTITGTADGFNTDNPNKRVTATFQIKAAC